MDAETTVLDKYVGQRVDSMVDAGLLDEVYDIYKPGADYTRGIRQSIGVREFEDFLKTYLPDTNSSANDDDKALKEHLRKILDSPKDDKLRVLLEEAIDGVKLNTRRLLRRQVSKKKKRFGDLIDKRFILFCMLCFRKGESIGWKLSLAGLSITLMQQSAY